MQRRDKEAGSPGEAWEIEGLPAYGPNPELEGKLALFGQFIGDWDVIENRYLRDDGTWSKERGRIHWRWILEGRATQDVWASIDEETEKEMPWGTTVRFYDPKIGAWRSTWISPRQGAVAAFIGRKVGREIVLERRNEEGCLVKWIFSGISRDSFRWHAEESRDGGKTWTLKEEMKIRRRRQ
jgi:hypothetical protein